MFIQYLAGRVCEPHHGAGVTVFTAIVMGPPIFTTHTIAGTIAGVGAVKSFGAVRWNIADEIVFAWTLTLPAAASMGEGVYALTRLVS